MARSAPRPPPPAHLACACVALLTGTLVTGDLLDDVRGGPVAVATLRSNSSVELLASLRRQLMANNYDYMSTESEEFPAQHELDAPRAAPDSSASPLQDEGVTPALLPSVNDIYIPRVVEPMHPPPLAPVSPPQPPPALGADFAFVSDEAQDSAASSRGLDKNDLLYYMDDGHLTRRRAAAVADAATDVPDDQLAIDTAPKVKYKMLKVKAPAGSRRSGAGGAGGGEYRRFLQEEGEDGVAIINLGDEPFPEFRLPSARRQYMSDEVLPDGALPASPDTAPTGSELEVALPSDIEEEPVMPPSHN